MSSMIATWSGQCERPRRKELIGCIRKLASRNEEYWTAYPEPLNAFSRMLHAQRSNGLPTLPTTRDFNGAIWGRILLDSDVLGSDSDAVDELKEAGLPFHPDQRRPRRGMFELERAVLIGIDFRLFDALGLYPGEDRLSCVFLALPDYPALDGRLVHVHTEEQCRTAQHPDVRRATAYLEAPFIHLRNHFVTWTDRTIGWMRRFFIPGLTYRRGDVEAQEDGVRDEAAAGRREAIGKSFEALCADFEAECDASVSSARGIEENMRLPRSE